VVTTLDLHCCAIQMCMHGGALESSINMQTIIIAIYAHWIQTMETSLEQFTLSIWSEWGNDLCVLQCKESCTQRWWIMCCCRGE